jgi:hypothetical protein
MTLKSTVNLRSTEEEMTLKSTVNLHSTEEEMTLKSTVNLHHILKHAATPCPRPLSSVALDCLCHTPDDRKSVDCDDQHTQKSLCFGNSFPISSQSRFCEETNR